MSKNSNKTEKAINHAYNYLSKADLEKIAHYYNKYDKSQEVSAKFHELYDSTKATVGIVSGAASASVGMALDNAKLDTAHTFATSVLILLGSYSIGVLIDYLVANGIVSADYASKKNKFKEASEIVKMANIVDDDIAKKVMYIDEENLKRVSFNK